MAGQLTPFNQAKKALAEAVSIDEVKKIRDKLEALRAYHKQAGESLEMQNQCAEIKIRAERRAGELLAEMKIQHGARGRGINQHNKDKKVEVLDSHDETPPLTLAELGIDRNQSSRWKKIAKIPEHEFEDHIQRVKENGEELTSAGVYRLAARVVPKEGECDDPKRGDTETKKTLNFKLVNLQNGNLVFRGVANLPEPIQCLLREKAEELRKEIVAEALLYLADHSLEMS